MELYLSDRRRKMSLRAPQESAAACRYETVPNQIQPFRRVYMLFRANNGWHVSFLESDLTNSPLRPLTFVDPEDVRDLARRGHALETSQARALFDYELGRGGGGIYLQLTPEQYSKLRNPCS